MSIESSRSIWNNAIVYQVYPWSFNEHKDIAASQGHGSIRGIVEKLDYLKSLGVDAIWLSPFYDSPMLDGGYDVRDGTKVHPELGNDNDIRELIRQVHQRGIKVMVDFVPNHTSDDHQWFIESRNNTDKSDWYIWSDGVIDKDGQIAPPNNWASVFSLPQLEARKRGELDLPDDALTPPISAWTYDEKRLQYYLHSFASFQPDLNWDNPAVREAQKNIMRYWLDCGVDAFRIDAVNYIGKDPSRRDEKMYAGYQEGIDNPYDQLWRHYSSGFPDTFLPYCQEMIDVLYEDAYRDRDARIVFEYYGHDDELRRLDELDPAKAGTFNFVSFAAPWDANERKKITDHYYDRIKGGIGSQINGNHDNPRIASRFGLDEARAAAVMNLLLPGMVYIYQGEELNLTNGTIPIGRIKDPNGLRDGARQPMVWDDARPNAGFSDADESELYLPINNQDLNKSVVRQTVDTRSTLRLYQELIKIRQSLDWVADNGYVKLECSDNEVFAYGHRYSEGIVVVLVNFERIAKTVSIEQMVGITGEMILSSLTVMDRRAEVNMTHIELMPSEAIVIVCADTAVPTT